MSLRLGACESFHTLPRSVDMKAMKGLTLIELLMALAILGVLFGAVLPAFGSLLERSASAAINNELIASLSLARSEALRSRQLTVVCPARADVSGCRSDGAWHHGWMVFVDANQDGELSPGRDRLLLVHEPLSSATLISGHSRPRVRYAPNGLNTGSNLSIRLCQAGTVVSAVIVNNVGRTRLERDARALARWSCPV